MKQNTLRIFISCGVAIAACSIGIYNTPHRSSSNSVDYQLKINYQAHPLASIIGSVIPGIIAGFAFYWWDSRCARRKQKNLSSINPKEAASLLDSNIDGQHDDAINGFLLNATARDIQEFILNIHQQSGYVQRAKTALDVRIAENSEINSRRMLYLTVALVVLTVALLAFPFLQMITNKNHDVVKAVANISSVTQATSRSLSASGNRFTGTDSWMNAGFPDDNSAPENPVTVPSAPDSASEFDKDKKLAENVGAQDSPFEYNKAEAEKGDADAQWFLAIGYFNGWDVETNLVEAYKWFNLASAQGNESAKKYLSVLEKKMTPEQIAEGQRLAREFQPHTESASTNSN